MTWVWASASAKRRDRVEMKLGAVRVDMTAAYDPRVSHLHTDRQASVYVAGCMRARHICAYEFCMALTHIDIGPSAPLLWLDVVGSMIDRWRGGWRGVGEG